jgi:hypothetical protein
MSQVAPREIAKKPVVYQLPGMSELRVRQNVRYMTSGTDELTMDIYYPPEIKSGAQPPLAIIVDGYSDFRTPNLFGCTFKEMAWTTSWARLLAVSGMAVVTYSPREPDQDLQVLLQFCRDNSASLGTDVSRMGLLAASGNAANALAALTREGGERFRAAAICYGFTLDMDGSTVVAEAGKQYGFVTPPPGKSVEDLPRDLSLFIVRAGRDQFAGLNDSLDRFVAGVVKRNIPVTFINHATGVHGFDLWEDNETSRRIIQQTLDFMAHHLLAP